MISITIAAICGVTAGWCLCKKMERIQYDRRCKRSKRICARKAPRRVVTAGDDYSRGE